MNTTRRTSGIAILSSTISLFTLGLSLFANSANAQSPLPGGGGLPIPPSTIVANTLSSGSVFTTAGVTLQSASRTVGSIEKLSTFEFGYAVLPDVLTLPDLGTSLNFSVLDTPLPGGGGLPIPPSVAVVAVVNNVAVYADGTYGFANGDFLYTNGVYMWADGFVRYGSSPSNFIWTDGEGTALVTTRGDITSTGGKHVQQTAPSN